MIRRLSYFGFRAFLIGLNQALLVILVSLGSSLALANEHANRERNWTVDDLLRTEAIDRVVFSPGARFIVLEYSGPWETLSDFGVAGAPYDRLGSATLLYADLDSGTPLQPLIDHSGDSGYWIDSFSPSGRYLAYSKYSNGRVNIGVYDFENGSNREFGITPFLSRFQSPPIWISDSEVVYSVLDDEKLPPGYFDRRAIDYRQRARRETSWTGSHASVSVLSSGSATTAKTARDKVRGALVRLDVKAGAVTQLSPFPHVNVQRSVGGRYISALRLGGFVQEPSSDLSAPFLENRHATLEVFDLKNGARSQIICSDCNVVVGTVSWPTDDNHVSFFSRSTSGSLDSGHYSVYDFRQGTLTPVLHQGLDLVSERERWITHRPERATWMGTNLAVFARPAKSPGKHGFPMPAGDWSTARSQADWFRLDDQGPPVNLTGELSSASPYVIANRDESVLIYGDGSIWKVTPKGGLTNLTEEIPAFLTVSNLHSGYSSYRNLSLFRRASTFEAGHVIRSWEETTDFVLLIEVEAEPKFRKIILPSDAGEIKAVDFAAGVVAFTQTVKGSETVSLAYEDGRKKDLVTINEDFSSIARAERVSIEYEYGTERLTGCAYVPHAIDKDQKLPVVVEVYPNVEPVCSDSDRVRSTNELFASNGYIYFQPHTPRRLLRTESGPVSNMSSILAAALDGLDKRGFADTGRLGLYGVSQGGWIGPLVLSETSIFDAAVAINGIADHASFYGDLSLASSVLQEEWFRVGAATRYEMVSSDFYLGEPPWVDPSAYTRNSPYFRAHHIDTPLMLVHSDLDFFPSDQYEQLFTALYRQRKDVVFVRYWGEGHWLNSPANVRDYWERVFVWYDKYLRGTGAAEP